MKIKMLFILAVIVMVACTTRESSQVPEQDLVEVSKIGAQIAPDAAREMIDRHTSKYGNEDFAVDRLLIEKILEAGAEGIYIYNAMDTDGRLLLILSGVDAGRNLVGSFYTHEGILLEKPKVLELTSAFQTARPESARAFLFGDKLFIELPRMAPAPSML